MARWQKGASTVDVFDKGSYFLVSLFLGGGAGRVRVVVGLSWMVGVEGVVVLV